MHTPDFLINYVHKEMEQKYVNSLDKDLENKAIILQDFFQTIKNRAQGISNSSNIFDDEIIDMILEEIYTNGSFFLKNAKANRTFLRSERSYKNGTSKNNSNFERELVSIYEAVWNQVAADNVKFDKSQVWVGSQKSTVFNTGKIVQGTDKNGNLVDLGTEIMEKQAKELGVTTCKILEKQADGSVLKQYYIPYVQGKPDVKGYTIDIKADPNPKMLEIYNLLKECVFSAKNYSSKTWDKDLKELVENKKYTSLGFGESKFYRSVYGSLSGLGYDNKTAISAVFAGNNRLKSGDKSDTVREHFYHLRYLYEITGTGTRDISNLELFGPEVNFVVFNNPAGSGIYVKTAQSLIADMLKTQGTFNKKWDSRIQIAKSKFYNK